MRGLRTTLALLLLAALVCPSAVPAAEKDYQVGAYYYLWYPNNFDQGYLRAKLVPPQQPALGRYYSAYPKKTIARQIDWAAGAGIDFWAVSYWPLRPKLIDRLDNSLLKAPNLNRIKWCLFYETYQLGFNAHYGATVFSPGAVERFVQDMKSLAEKYFGLDSYLKINGRPVIILYLTRTFLGDYPRALALARAAWREMGLDPFIIGDEVFWVSISDDSAGPLPRRGAPGYDQALAKLFKGASAPQVKRMALFDAVTAYNMYAEDRPTQAGYGSESTYVSDLAARYAQYRAAAQKAGTAFVPNILPGYNDRGHRLNQNHYAIPRQWQPGGPPCSFLARAWDRLAKPFIDPKLKMVLITSFNEWNEDTQLEPTAPAEATNRDSSPSGRDYTQGYRWTGYGLECLKTLKNKMEN